MNTLASFREAIAQGATGIELDVHLSADGQVIVIHDDTLEATTNGTGPVGELTLAQLKALDAGAWFDSRFTGERIPTLLEVFADMPVTTMVNVEIKSRYGLSGNDLAALVGLTLDVVRSCKRESTVIFSSFDPRAIRLLTRLAPEIERALLIDRKRPWWLALASLGLKLQAVHPHRLRVTGRMVAAAHRRGRRVNVWTVNDPAEAKRLTGLGVDALISNRPAEIQDGLQTG